MNKLKLLIIVILSLNDMYAQKKTTEKDKLITCLKQEKFLSYFNVCKEKADTVYIYNNTLNFNKFKSIKISCNKILMLKKSSIKIDVNSPNLNCQNTIVLYEYEVKNGRYRLGFLDICSNGNMVIELNSKDKIIAYRTGVF